ncbi:hypothetical protein GCM10011491_07390 [Brucella endophytica]|uniref:Uncharacterized protein n=1 Tax=Brucella endophytica TaxID=1963359 RepID=A0A916S5W0_9HYPH|nr:hypothetical protein [Brucella endophytica]GGA82488.1 hypothetical protein GCM10011491_07390 [Brucella endophytica]
MSVKLNPIGAATISNSSQDYKPYFVNLHRKNKTFYILSGVLDGFALQRKGTAVTSVTYANGKVEASSPISLSETHAMVAIHEIKQLMYGGPFSAFVPPADFSIKVYDMRNNFKQIDTIHLPRPSGVEYNLQVVSLQCYWNFLVVGVDPFGGTSEDMKSIIYIINLNDYSEINYYYDDDVNGDGIRNFSIFMDKLYWVTFNSSLLSWYDLKKKVGDGMFIASWQEQAYPDGSAVDRTGGRIFIPNSKYKMEVYDITVTPPLWKSEFPIPVSVSSIDIDPFRRLIYLCGYDGHLVVVDSKAESVLQPIYRPTPTALLSVAVHEYDHVVCTVSPDDKQAFLYQQVDVA